MLQVGKQNCSKKDFKVPKKGMPLRLLSNCKTTKQFEPQGHLSSNLLNNQPILNCKDRKPSFNPFHPFSIRSQNISYRN